MNSARLQKRLMTKRRLTTAAALAAALLGAGPAFAGDAPNGTRAGQAPAMTSEAPAPTESARIDRTRPGRRQPAFGLRRLTPPPATTQPAPNRPM